MPPEAVFGEVTAERHISQLPLAHVSIELGHLYMEDFAAGIDRLREQFRQVAPWVATARAVYGGDRPGRRGRVSTCFLIDDYFSRFGSPAEVVPMLVEAAADSGLAIDYVARESCCVEADKVALAALVEARLVSDPPPGTNGSRPPVTETGWLCNGQRSPVNEGIGAMEETAMWRPPVQNAARRHSIFADIELWDEKNGQRTWSCPFLAAVWQLLRLGLLRNLGRSVVHPVPWAGAFPQDWDELPPIVRLTESAAPFSAYRTVSVLAGRFLPIELAVRTILGQVAVDAQVLRQIEQRSEGEGIRLADEIVDRVGYIFLAGT